MDFISHITIRARVSFYIALAEKLFEGIDNKDDGYTEARKALDKCWAWLEGKDVTADELYEYLENVDDTGLMIYAYDEKDPNKVAIWNIVITSLMYIIWHAYTIEGAEYVPQTIEAVDETIIDYLINYTSECHEFNKSWMDLLERYLLKNYRTDSINEYGNPVDKNEIMRVIDNA